MSIINRYHSAFDDSLTTLSVDQNISIREALPDLDYERAIIYVNGNEACENHVLQDDDICTIREFPAGKPGSSAGEIILGVLTLGAYTLTDSIVAGVTGKTIGQHIQDGLMKWLAPDASATASNDAETLKDIPQLKGAKTQSNRNKPIPIVLGEHLYTPMVVGTPYSEIGGADGEDQYYNALYLLGWGQLKVREIRLGPWSGLAENPDGLVENICYSWNNNPGFFGANFIDPSFKSGNPQIELRQDGEASLYPQRVVEERLNIELKNVEGENPFEVIRFTAKNPDKVQIEILLNNGLISYKSNGDEQDATVNIRVEWRGKPTDNWQEFKRLGTNGGLSPTGYNAATHITTITRKKAKVMRFIAERNFTLAEAEAAVNRTVELRVMRTNAKATDTRTCDAVYLTAIRTWCFDYEASQETNVMVPQRPMIQKYRDKTARLGFRIKVTDNMQGTIDALNCIVTSYARTWNGSTWSSSETPTNNPASIALKMLQSPALGENAYTDSMIDLYSFGEFYEWCRDREYTCNGVLTSERRVNDLVNAVLATGRGMLILNGNKYAVLIDKPRENPVTVLNSQNVLEAKNQKSFEDLPDGFSIKFIDANDGYQETEVNVMANGSSKPGPTSRLESLEMPFVTDYKQVIKNGRYLLACRHLRPEVWVRKLSIDGYLVGIGSRVEVQDDTIVVGLGEGGVIKSMDISNNVITKLHTDGNFEVTDMNKVYGLKIVQADGINSIKVRTLQVSVPAPGLHSDFSVYIPLSDTVVPHEGDIVSFGVSDKITTPAICFGKKDNGDGTFEVTLIPYQEGIYTTDSGPIPPYNAFITTPQRLPPPPSDAVTKGEVMEIAKEFGAGEPASMYRLMPSAVIIRRYMDGVTIPDTVSCGQVLITGSNTPIASNKTIKYKTNTTNGEVLYTGEMAVMDSWEYVNFYLYDGDTLLDFEEIPVLSEGSLAVVLDVNPDLETLIYEYDGTPVPGQLPLAIKATLYKGLTEISNSILGQSAVRLYPGHGDQVFTPLPNGRYPVSTAVSYLIQWSLEDAPHGVSIDDDGEITVAVNAKLAVRNEITAVAVYEGQRYAKRFLVCVVTNGAPGPAGRDAMFIDLSNEHISMIAKTDGTLYSHPAITSQAMLFLGATELLEGVAWSISPAVGNVSISASGLVTIAAAYTQTVDRVEVNVYAEYHGQTYTVVLTIYRVKDGPDGTPAVVYHLHPSTSAVKRNTAGTPDPSTLSCKVFRITGSSPPAEDQTKTVKYSTSASAIENTLNYNSSISIPAAQTGGLTWIKLMLYDGSTLLDGPETIPIVQDGQPGQKGDKGDPGAPGSAAGVAKYLGKTVTTTNNSSVYIQYTSNNSLSVTANVGDWIAYVGTSLAGTSPWQKYYCLQWRGTSEGWVKLDPLSSEYTAHYMEALGDITDGAPMGVFSAILAKKIMTQEMVSKIINTQEIVMKREIITGAEDLGTRESLIRSDNFVAGSAGFRIRYNGDVEFNIGTFRGALAAATGTFKGELQAATGSFAGELQAAKGTFAGALQAASISITGTHTAGNGVIVTRCNQFVTNTSTTVKVLKTLHIAGKGTCNLTISFTGYLQIDVQDAEHNWQNIRTDTCQNMAEETRTYAITLPNNVNKIRMLGGRYSWGGGSYQDFKSTICAAYVRDNPGIFSYMSYGEAHDL